MKKLIATTLLCTAAGLAAYAQGTVNFANAGAGFNAPVVLNDGTTKAGAGYTAILLAGPTGGTLAQIATTAILSTSPGYFLGGVQSIPTVAGGGTANVMIEIYNSGTYSSFATAKAANTANAWAASSTFTVKLGDPNASPPTTPGSLSGLGTTPLTLNSGGVVPEPSTFALAGLGAAALLFFRRRS